MNCKPGDLAIVIKSHAGNLGKVVICGQLVMNPPGFMPGAWWTTDVPLNFTRTRTSARLSYDSYMIPLRSPDCEDESPQSIPLTCAEVL